MADESFKEFVRDQLAALPGLRLKAMFGGCGVYQANQFFGIIMDGRLYLRIDPHLANEYVARGLSPFTYQKGKRVISLNYFEVPASVLENRDELLGAARQAIQAADRNPKRTA
jgi:DNA transformation protein and related proteins